MKIIGKLKEWSNRRKREKAVNVLESELQDRMVRIDEMMDLKEMADVYSKYVCKKNGWNTYFSNYLNKEFCEISFAFIAGFTKALHDNGLEFRNGLVKKRDITNEMPIGALEYYRKDTIAETKAQAIEVLQKVMEKYETSKTNIATIVNAFKKEIKID